jgi:hypothetical protein
MGRARRNGAWSPTSVEGPARQSHSFGLRPASNKSFINDDFTSSHVAHSILQLNALRPQLQTHYILNTTDASFDLIQAIPNGLKPFSNNLDISRQFILPILQQTFQTPHRGLSTLRTKNLFTNDESRIDSLRHFDVCSSSDLRADPRPRGIKRSKGSRLACGGPHCIQDGVHAGAIWSRCYNDRRVVLSRSLEAFGSAQ